MEEKLILWLTFNPGLARTGFRTTRLWVLLMVCFCQTPYTVQFSVKVFISIVSITLTVDLFQFYGFKVLAEVIYCFIIEQP